MPAPEAVPATEIIVGYGSLLSKRGIARDGTAPRVHRAWAMRIPGRRGFSHTAPSSRRMAMDAHIEEARVLSARGLPGFVEGGPAVAGPPPPWTDPEPSFEGLGMEIDRADWKWLAGREGFPAGLPHALALDAASRSLSVAAHLGGIMARSGLEDYAEALYDQYRTRLDDPDRRRFHASYLPYPLHLPERDDRDVPLGHEWALVCAVPQKPLPALTASEAARRPGCDRAAFTAYYVECVLGGVHGIDVADIRDTGFERAEPDAGRLLTRHAPAERRALAEAAGAPHAIQAGPEDGMHPVEAPIALSDALDRLASLSLRPKAQETVGLDAALGRVLARDAVAAVDAPPAAKSAMDGYALRAGDTVGAGPKTPRRLRLVGSTMAGEARAPAVVSGTCVQIATGALLPEGADAVVMVEMTRRDADAVEVLAAHSPGQNVHAQGSDFHAGAVLVPAGRRLGPAQIAALATTGMDRVPVHRRPVVVVAATGDEVLPAGAPLPVGAVYDSNSPMLAALATRLGAAVERHAPAADDPDTLARFLAEACGKADLVLLSGGTSAGPRDLLPRLLASQGRVLFHGVRIRPGKPVVAAEVDGTLVLGLPGYPASCLLSAELFAVPALRRLGGDEHIGPVEVRCTLAQAVESKQGWVSLVTVALDGGGRAVPTFRGSAAITSLAGADGFFLVPEPTTEVHAGSEVAVRPFH